MSGVTQEMCDREPFRWCVFCDVDCDAGEEHTPECPSSTGVFPVREKDVRCPGCKQTYLGMRCGECEAEFAVGDHYLHHELLDEDGEPFDPPGYLVICIGCAASKGKGA